MSSPAVLLNPNRESVTVSEVTVSDPRGRFPRRTWSGPAGLRTIFIVAFPLIVTNVTHSLNLFFDRLFLSQYSKEAFAATLQAGAIHWTLMSLFFGTVTYAGTFIAQYTGARRPERVGPALWQGLYLAVLSGVILAGFYFAAPPFFQWVGHEGILPTLEAQYFQIFALGSWAILLKDGLAGFYIGRGKTGMVMAVNAFVCTANVFLNWWLIFHPPQPLPGGVQGAALASVIAAALGAIVFALLIFRRRHDAVFHVRRGWRLDRGIFTRLLRFGLPSGVHHMVDMTAFSTFMLVVGKFGFEAQFASNVALNVNFLLFIPAVGIAHGASILAGQFAGARTPDATQRLTTGTLMIAGAYMAVCCVLYLTAPGFFAGWFRGDIPDAEWAPIVSLARTLFIIVAVYSVFDAVVLSISGVLRGSGDTKFVMLLSLVFAQVLLTGPCLALVALREHVSKDTGLLLAWAFCSGYILFLCTAFLLRYRAGTWKTIRVIEDEPAAPGTESTVASTAGITEPPGAVDSMNPDGDEDPFVREAEAESPPAEANSCGEAVSP
jgi:MATE family multidrug resistance protein